MGKDGRMVLVDKCGIERPKPRYVDPRELSDYYIPDEHWHSVCKWWHNLAHSVPEKLEHFVVEDYQEMANNYHQLMELLCPFGAPK